MIYAHVTNGTVDQVGLPPQLVFDGVRWWDLRPLDPVVLAGVGWYTVVEATRPADTATTTWDAVFTLTGSVVAQSWVERAKTQAELTAIAAATNESSIETNLAQDMTAMQAIIDATNSTINSSPASYMKDIARANRRLIRMALQKFDGTN
jgi:hypothetical protein